MDCKSILSLRGLNVFAALWHFSFALGLTVATAVEAMKVGAIDYVLKPFKLNPLLPALERALTVRRLRAANAALETVRDLYFPTPEGEFHSVAVLSDGSYGIPKGIVSSFPVRTDGKKWEIVQGLPIDAFIKAKIDLSVKELQEERECIKELIPA